MRVPSFLMAAALVAAGAPALRANEAAGLSVAVSMAPAPSAPEAYVCAAEIRDLETGRLLASPRIILPRGESGRASVGDPAAFEAVVDVRVDRAGTAAEYTVTCRRKGRVAGVHKGSLSLRASG